MIDRAAALAAVLQQLLVGSDFNPGIDLVDDIGPQRRSPQNPSQDLQSLDIRGPIDLGCEIIDANLWRSSGIGAPDAQRASALGP